MPNATRGERRQHADKGKAPFSVIILAKQAPEEVERA